MYKGTDKISQIYKGTKPVRRIYKGDTLVYKIAPSGYVGTEYLESDGNQYIGTGVNANVGTTFKLDIQFIEIGTEELNGKTWYDDGGCSIGYATNSSTTQFLVQAGHQIIHNGTLDTNRHQFSLKIDSSSQATFIVDGVSQQGTITFTQSQYNLVLFARRNQNNSVEKYCTEKLYACKIYDNSTKQRDMQPYVRLSDGEAGLYDLVNDVFYTNQGTGKFKYGKFKNIPDGYAQVDLGTLEWSYGGTYFSVAFSGIKLVNTSVAIDGLCCLYNILSMVNISSSTDKSLAYNGERIYIRDTSYTDATTFKNAMSGIWLLYKKA